MRSQFHRPYSDCIFQLPTKQSRLPDWRSAFIPNTIIVLRYSIRRQRSDNRFSSPETSRPLYLTQQPPSLSLCFHIAQHSDRRGVDLSIRTPLERTLHSGTVATAPRRRASAYERGHTPSTMPALAPSYQQLGQRNNYQIPLEQLNIA